jgi:hypothetical protein
MTDPSDRFAKFLGTHPVNSVELPLVHNTRCELLQAIASSGALEPTPCPVFKQNLIYCFYGRPVYRSSKVGLEYSTDYPHCPICLVFRRDAIRNITRVYPCDSGGLSAGAFDPPISAGLRDLFEISRTAASAQRITTAFFGSNRQYYDGIALQNPAIPQTELEAKMYHALISTRGTSSFDERRSAVEVQTPDRIELRNNVAYVILPAGFLEEPDIRETILCKWRAEPITYSTSMGGIPAEYTRSIIDRFRQLLESGGYL